jgi:pyruvate,orthophosphate dikinase
MANGTAVNVCTMVFGNMGDDSATGVGFTRNPGTGENVIYGEYLVNAQGEDVVAGIRTPKPVAEMEQEMPDLYRQLVGTAQPPGNALQGSAGLRVHHREGHAVLPADPQRQDECPGPGAHLGGDVQGRPDRQGKGPAAHPSGHARTVAGAPPRRTSRASRWPRACRPRPAPPPARSCSTPTGRDCAVGGEKHHPGARGNQARGHPRLLPGQGILTSRGGKTSHAAVVARGMGKPCVSGCEAIHIDDIKRCATIGDTTLHEGDVVTIDGGNGKVYAGEVPTVRGRVQSGHGDPAEVGRPGGAPEGDGQCRHPRGCRQARAASAPWASACAAPSACSTPPIACPSCRR